MGFVPSGVISWLKTFVKFWYDSNNVGHEGENCDFSRIHDQTLH
jgi:hypothetical protein